MDFRNAWNKMKGILVFLVVFEIYLDALSISMRFGVIFCIYEHILKYICYFAYLYILYICILYVLLHTILVRYLRLHYSRAG